MGRLAKLSVLGGELIDGDRSSTKGLRQEERVRHRSRGGCFTLSATNGIAGADCRQHEYF